MSEAEVSQPKPEKRFPIRLDFILVVVVIVTAFLGLWDDKAAGLVEVGSPAPDFDFVVHQGGRVRLADYKGKVVLLDYWATWCPPCVEEMPWLVAYADRFKDNGVELVAVSHDEPETRAQALEKFFLRVPGLAPRVVYGDPVASKRYGVVALPTLYVIGRNGKIVARARGQVDPDKVKDWIREASEARE
jgi:peroxiredoxin